MHPVTVGKEGTTEEAAIDPDGETALVAVSLPDDVVSGMTLPN